MSPTLLLALGNDLLSDDAIGLRVAAAVHESIGSQENLTIIQTAEMGLSLLDYIVGFDRLVLLDAIQTQQAPPGFVHEIEEQDLRILPTISPHFLGVSEVLAFGRELGFAMPKEVSIFAIEVQDPFTVSTQMTPALQAALPGIAERVRGTL